METIKKKVEPANAVEMNLIAMDYVERAKKMADSNKYSKEQLAEAKEYTAYLKDLTAFKVTVTHGDEEKVFFISNYCLFADDEKKIVSVTVTHQLKYGVPTFNEKGGTVDLLQ